MKSWSVCSTFLSLSLSVAILFCLPSLVWSQNLKQPQGYGFTDTQPDISIRHGTTYSLNDTLARDANSSLPKPKSVLYKSMIIPGWGQIVNKQAWKVPIVYGILGGLGYYSVHLTKKYHDYRAAYYNLNEDTPDDLRFGPTPSYIPESANLQEVKNLRNQFRNNRDLVYVGIVLAYGLNIIDAYVFAHMRSFDVSEDLSMRPRIKPAVMAKSMSPGVTLSIDLIAK